jgi:peptidoglycan/LPS O-acetylase OafA/YrhL
MTPREPGSEFNSYRPDVDGLRAIAVLAVIAFHALPSAVTGGFVGVDVFFVISGFLISGLIAKEMENGSFTFRGFYTRRIKRIFPAYIVVALTTLIVSSLLLIPNDYIFYTTSLAASWAFVSNVFFSMLSWGYFGQRTEEFPLLHTWSLSVEEQFYFVFPILLLLLYRYMRGRIVPALLLLGMLFLAYSEWRTGQIKSYFLITSRAHELIIGALVYFLSQRLPVGSRSVSNLLALTGAVLVLGSFALLSPGVPFPGINSLYPCLGTALLIYSGRTRHSLTPLLESRLMVWIGLISYPLYLWHWPIFSFLRYRKVELTSGVIVAAVALAFLLAWLTWRMIETPIRRNRAIGFNKAFTQIYLAPAIFFGAVGAWSYFTEGAPQRFPDEIRQLIASYSFERDLTRSCSIRPEDYRKIDTDYLQKNCAFGDLSQQQPQVLLLGDSHAHHFKPFVEELSKNAGLKAVYHVQGGCFPIYLDGVGPQPASLPGPAPHSCQRRNADLLEIAGRFKYVVLAGFWSSEMDANLERRMLVTVEKIVAAGAVPVIFKDNPSYEPDLSRCILYRKRGWISQEANCNIPYDAVLRTQTGPDQMIEHVKARFPKTLVIDPKRVMCNNQECATFIANTALYKDGNHLNAKAAQLLADRYISNEGNPLSAHYRQAQSPAADMTRVSNPAQ